jgi:hypothetical protein
LNLYTYVENNPLKYQDPSGNVPILIPVAVWAGKHLVQTATGMAMDLAIAKATGKPYNVMASFTDNVKDISGAGKVKKAGKVVEAVKDVGKNAAKNNKPSQIHHYVTNKSKKYTPQMESITKKYNLNLDHDWNKELLPHQGRHPYDYHDYVLDKLNTYDRLAKGDKQKFLKLFEGLKKEVRENPDILYKDYWRSK